MDETLELKDGQNIVIKASNQHPNKGEVVKYTIKSVDKDVSEIHYSGNVWFNDRIGNIENSLSQEFQTLDDNGNLVMYVNLTSKHIKDGVYYFNELHLKRNILPDYIQLNRQDLIERFKDSNLPIYTIEELQQMAYDMVGKPEGIEVSHDPKDVVAIIEYRDGSIIDVVRKPLL